MGILNVKVKRLLLPFVHEDYENILKSLKDLSHFSRMLEF